MEIPQGDYVVIGDIHGRVDKLQAVYDLYGDRPDGYLSTGDNIDGPDSKRCIEILMKYMGALIVDSNHERNLRSAMYHPDEEVRNIAATALWPRTHDRLLESYGVYPGIPSPGMAIRLKEKMENLGHMQYLESASGYIEGEDFALIHADVTEEDWQKQRKDIDIFEATWLYESDERIMPYQLGDDVKNVVESNLAASGLSKTLISGHFHHSTRNIEDRKLNNGQHLLLATWPNNDYVFTYETWTKQIRLIDLV